MIKFKCVFCQEVPVEIKRDWPWHIADQHHAVATPKLEALGFIKMREYYQTIDELYPPHDVIKGAGWKLPTAPIKGMVWVPGWLYKLVSDLLDTQRGPDGMRLACDAAKRARFDPIFAGALKTLCAAENYHAMLDLAGAEPGRCACAECNQRQAKKSAENRLACMEFDRERELDREENGEDWYA